MSDATFFELGATGLISVEGDDAATFLHAQLTSDVAGLTVAKTQYSGYCSPKGRLLATFLVWRLQDRVCLQLPLGLSETIRARLARYVLRAKVKLSDMRSAWTLFGVSGRDAAAAVGHITDTRSIALHDVVAAAGIAATRVSATRYLILASAVQASAVRAALETVAHESPEEAWHRLDIEAGIPWITEATQDAYVPQMVNLDLIGALTYSKGCYPGQEIVARTHYLGRVKQRMHRIHLSGAEAPAPGDPLYSARFGNDQASGTVVNAAARAQNSHDALAVIQITALDAGSLHWKSPDGPPVELLSLPYEVPV
jgi:tRNA-modifying protein YgfZ